MRTWTGNLQRSSVLLHILVVAVIAAQTPSPVAGAYSRSMAFSPPVSTSCVLRPLTSTSRGLKRPLALAPKCTPAKALVGSLAVAAGGKGFVGVALMASQGQSDGVETQEVMVAELAALTDSVQRLAAVREKYAKFDGIGLSLVSTKAQQGDASYQALLSDLQTLTNERLEAGKQLLADLLDSGEINVLDRKIVQGVKSGGIDPAFVQVLNMNIDAAQQGGEGSTNTLQILSHIYTRVQEEIEKKIDPAVGLLHRLLRNANEPGIRANVMEHFFKPKEEDQHETVFVDGQMKILKGALVDPLDFSRAMSQYLEQIRGGNFDEEAVGQTFEDCRVIAKEARAMVESMYDSDTLDEFTESLTPVFQPIMTTLEKYRK